jgi:hypothetical protein
MKTTDYTIVIPSGAGRSEGSPTWGFFTVVQNDNDVGLVLAATAGKQGISTVGDSSLRLTAGWCMERKPSEAFKTSEGWYVVFPAYVGIQSMGISIQATRIPLRFAAAGRPMVLEMTRSCMTPSAGADSP